MEINQIKILMLFINFMVFFVNKNSAIVVTHIQNLGTMNNLTSLLVNIDLLSTQFRALAQVNNRNADICDRVIILKTDITGLKIRERPKGTCPTCCKIIGKDIQFLLFTEENPEKGKLLPKSKKSRRYPDLNKYKKVIIYIHGFIEVIEVGTANILKNAYLQKNENYAVIVIDWSNLVSLPWYIDATINTQIVGNMLAFFLERYVDMGRLKMENVHIIGFSLGAHVAGFSGKFLRRDLRIPRITGLDPAYPRFELVIEGTRLSKRDADFVDVIHTDAGKFGIPFPIAHVDFYPNGGTDPQPDCNYKDLARGDEIYNFISCSHTKAVKYYIETLTSPYNFPAVKCEVDVAHRRISDCNNSDVAYMGMLANDRHTGVYYLKTNKDAPYGSDTYDISSSTDDYNDLWL